MRVDRPGVSVVAVTLCLLVSSKGRAFVGVSLGGSGRTCVGRTEVGSAVTVAYFVTSAAPSLMLEI